MEVEDESGGRKGGYGRDERREKVSSEVEGVAGRPSSAPTLRVEMDLSSDVDESMVV